MRNEITFIRVLLETSLERLFELDLAEEGWPELDLYRQTLLSSGHGRAEELADQLGKLENCSEVWRERFPELPDLVNLRLIFVRRTFTAELLRSFEARLPKPGPWRAEFHMLLAAGWETLENPQHAIELYRKASREFMSSGLKGKSLRARFNIAALLTHLDPNRRMLPEFYFLYRQARRLKQYLIASTALLNISREYHRMGAHRLALKIINRALARGSMDFHSQIYFLCIAQRAHVLLDLGRGDEARTDWEEARSSEFPVVLAACEVLERLLGKRKKGHKHEKHLLRTWRFQRERAPNSLNLSEQESELLRFVSLKRRTKYEIIDHLFPGAEHFTAENRLKNLVHRIRKKSKGVLSYEDGFYILSDRSRLPRKKVS